MNKVFLNYMQDFNKEKIEQDTKPNQPIEKLESQSFESQEIGEVREVEPETKREDIVYAPPPTDDEEEKVEVLKQAEKVREQKVEARQIDHLLELVNEKGVDFAIKVAKKTEDACLIDLLHDTLVKKGLYL